ncbi:MULTISPECIES: hypothetical protein, partial [unclassified Ruegeria]|uniref:hypothetical protein n=1 Tax=unclassified Ruegeria TaxID=2625375 RepID=UPI001C2BCD0A
EVRASAFLGGSEVNVTTPFGVLFDDRGKHLEFATRLAFLQPFGPDFSGSKKLVKHRQVHAAAATA